MKHFRVTYPLFVLLLFLAAFAPGSPASAASGRVTKGYPARWISSGPTCFNEQHPEFYQETAARPAV